ncbi:mannose 6-phosphate receptor domain-containing protein [Aureobasidium pullulans]|nr:mannose 6-phosphate receptor domain-containing protein [Aureobasidium pullulans]THX97713.1 mannose 6-phosphate receptor domain-containing protein [Aureobasidium pullulans]TIA85236.1 mannose 6-phosphate receptor domain-containing protein [Aureobasidium pullulans]
MQPSILYSLLAFALPAVVSAASDDSKGKKENHVPCTIRSPTSGAFFDLNPLHVILPDDPKKASKDARNESWSARGYDYGANFTINFCGPVVENLTNVQGVDEARWQNVSAFYELDGKTFSIGQQNAEPVFRGRKLVLNYTDGSPCPEVPTSSLLSRGIVGDDDDDDDKDDKHKDEDKDGDDKKSRKGGSKEPSSKLARRKNTIISLLCSTDPLAPLNTVSFVASPDSCTYIFEARSSAACGGIEVAKQQLGPSGVFGVIALIAVIVYVVGGCVYQRTVMHQRGWRQLPNYSLWAGIASFVSDMFVILFSSCARFLPGRKGYNRVGNNFNNGSSAGRRGRSNSDDENRLIDQLDEEWED